MEDIRNSMDIRSRRILNGLSIRFPCQISLGEPLMHSTAEGENDYGNEYRDESAVQLRAGAGKG